MKKEDRRIHAELHARVMKRLEAKFVRPVYNAIQFQIKTFTSTLRLHGIEYSRNHIDKILINDKLIKPIEDIYKFFGLYQARKTTRQINQSVKIKQPETKAGFGVNAELLVAIINYLKQFLLVRAVIPITQTTRQRILDMLIKGETEGWSVDKIASELESDELTLSRARMIVRTESLKAMQYGQQIAARRSRFETESEWIAANDHRTRHSHRIVDGDKVDEGKRFAVPIFRKGVQIGFDHMLGPGDPHASAGNVINCRCSLVTVAKRDKNGNLVPKQNNSLVLHETFI